MICAPLAAASSAKPIVFLKLETGSGEQDAWINPSFTILDFRFVCDTPSNSLKVAALQPHLCRHLVCPGPFPLSAISPPAPLPPSGFHSVSKSPAPESSSNIPPGLGRCAPCSLLPQRWRSAPHKPGHR